MKPIIVLNELSFHSKNKLGENIMVEDFEQEDNEELEDQDDLETYLSEMEIQ